MGHPPSPINHSQSFATLQVYQCGSASPASAPVKQKIAKEVVKRMPMPAGLVICHLKFAAIGSKKWRNEKAVPFAVCIDGSGYIVSTLHSVHSFARLIIVSWPVRNLGIFPRTLSPILELVRFSDSTRLLNPGPCPMLYHQTVAGGLIDFDVAPRKVSSRSVWGQMITGSVGKECKTCISARSLF